MFYKEPIKKGSPYYNSQIEVNFNQIIVIERNYIGQERFLAAFYGPNADNNAQQFLTILESNQNNKFNRDKPIRLLRAEASFPSLPNHTKKTKQLNKEAFNGTPLARWLNSGINEVSHAKR